MNSKVALPDMHYKVVDAEGNPSDVVTVTPDKNNSSVANMVANKEGMAIVLVTAGLLALSFMGFSGLEGGLKQLFGVE